ncbi:ammonium transporter [Paludisphaera mucosa]|uniref:Ammonium transporter n=1 Tax=Paludisphaera mucosa TaxID=3030827 RepID=A0ABT6FHQ7_9BACT|nr:ammonium transporter [Paludisphaera mucosa]MDG3007049.1 ammonium transporter [Paludisphaera mucosa]
MIKEPMAGLAWAGGILALALGATLARQLGYLDGDTVTRLVVGINGLMIAWYGNRMPKAVVPSAYVRQATRVGGWAMVLSGLVYAGVFMFAPIPVAVAVGCGAVLTGVAVTLGYCLWLRAQPKAV